MKIPIVGKLLIKGVQSEATRYVSKKVVIGIVSGLFVSRTFIKHLLKGGDDNGSRGS